MQKARCKLAGLGGLAWQTLQPSLGLSKMPWPRWFAAWAQTPIVGTKRPWNWWSFGDSIEINQDTGTISNPLSSRSLSTNPHLVWWILSCGWWWSVASHQQTFPAVQRLWKVSYTPTLVWFKWLLEYIHNRKPVLTPVDLLQNFRHFFLLFWTFLEFHFQPWWHRQICALSFLSHHSANPCLCSIPQPFLRNNPVEDTALLV